MSPEKRMKGHCVLTQSVVNEAMSSWLLFVVSRAGLHQPPAGLIYSNGSPTSLSKHQTGHLAMLADRLQNKFYCKQRYHLGKCSPITQRTVTITQKLRHQKRQIASFLNRKERYGFSKQRYDNASLAKALPVYNIPSEV